MTITEALVIESPLTSWWVDSAATRHIARNRELFVDLKEKQLGEHKLYMGNHTYSDVLGEGRCKFSIGDSVIVLNNMLYVPSVRRNLIYIPMLDEKGFEVKMKSSRVFISKGDISVSGVKVDGMYLLKCDINKDSIYDYLNVSNALNNTYLWHLHLGYINKQKMMRMSKSGLIPQINFDDFHICEP